MIHDLVESTNPILKQKMDNFDFINPPVDPTELTKDLLESLNRYNGYGLSANQLGLPYRVFVMKGNPNLVCFNPKIAMAGEEKNVLEEGCLSFPNLVVKVQRPKHVRVRFNTPSGIIITRQFTGMTARIFQHELDHLDGILFYERANRYHRDIGFKKMRKWNKQKAKEPTNLWKYTHA